MERKAIAVITEGESDILNALLKVGSIEVQVLKPDEVHQIDLNLFYSIAVLGGLHDKPLIFHPRDRMKIEEQLAKGKKVFCEFCGSISDNYYPEPMTTRFERLIFSWDKEIEGLETGDLMDDQCNMYLKPYQGLCSDGIPVLQYVNVNAHKKVDIKKDPINDTSKRALWFDRPDNLLICSFKLCNFIKARFTPRDKWKSLVAFILQWLCNCEVSMNMVQDDYCLKPYNQSESLEERLDQCIDMAMV